MTSRTLGEGESLIASDPRFAGYLQALHAPTTALIAYLDNEPLSTRLLRDSIQNDEVCIWYAEQGCVTKGYQWFESAQRQRVLLLVHALLKITQASPEEILRVGEEIEAEMRNPTPPDNVG